MIKYSKIEKFIKIWYNKGGLGRLYFLYDTSDDFKNKKYEEDAYGKNTSWAVRPM